MAVQLIVGTQKGVAVYEREAPERDWRSSFDLAGWSVTASARGTDGTLFIAVRNEIYGPAIFRREVDGAWKQLPGAPRYEPGQSGNEVHNLLIRSGLAWSPHQGPSRHVDQIWTLHAAHGKLYAGVSEAGLFVSEDGGESWRGFDGLNDHPTRADWHPGAGGLCAHTVLTDDNNPNRIWVGISAAGFFRSDDGGATFQPKNDGVNSDMGLCVHCVTHDPKHADTLYRQDHRGVYRSHDGGDTWQVTEAGLPIVELSDGHKCSFGFPIALDRASGALFVVPLSGDGQRMPADGSLKVYRSRDGGASWEGRGEGLPPSYFGNVLRGAMAADQAAPGGVYFGTTSGDIMASHDLGESWSQVARGLPRVLSVRAYAA